MKKKTNFGPEVIRKRVLQYMETSSYKKQIKALFLFGSFLKKKARGDSDVDLLIVFKDAVGYFTLVRIQNELSDALRRQVDLVTKDALSRYFRDEVLKEALPVYEK